MTEIVKITWNFSKQISVFSTYLRKYFGKYILNNYKISKV